jgi:hypothetical protein
MAWATTVFVRDQLVPGLGVGAELDGGDALALVPGQPHLAEPAAPQAPLEHPHLQVRQRVARREQRWRGLALDVGRRPLARAVLGAGALARFAHGGYRVIDSSRIPHRNGNWN